MAGRMAKNALAFFLALVAIVACTCIFGVSVGCAELNIDGTSRMSSLIWIKIDATDSVQQPAGEMTTVCAPGQLMRGLQLRVAHCDEDMFCVSYTPSFCSNVRMDTAFGEIGTDCGTLCGEPFYS